MKKKRYLFYLLEQLFQNLRVVCGKFLGYSCYRQKSPTDVEKHEIFLKKGRVTVYFIETML